MKSYHTDLIDMCAHSAQVLDCFCNKAAFQEMSTITKSMRALNEKKQINKLTHKMVLLDK